MAFQKRDKKQEGTKFLFYGTAGSGKTPTGLSFPAIALVDSDSGTNFYDAENVIVDESTLSFKELNDSLDQLELEQDLFDSIQTITIDSITRFHENMVHAMNHVAEKRAKKNNRDAEAEGLSFREYGKMKNYYEEFFARMLNYAKVGKNLVFVAEQKDKSENINGEVRKVGVVPNAQKDINYDFDVVVRTYNDKDGNPKGLVEKDRTKTFKVGTEVDKPNYEYWEDAVLQNLKGEKRKKEDVQTLQEAVNKEANELDDGEGIKDELNEIVMELSKEGKKDDVKKALEDSIGTIKFKTITDTDKLKAALTKVKELQSSK